MLVLKVKVISLPNIFKVLYVFCFTLTRYQVSVYRTIGPLVVKILFDFLYVHDLEPRAGNDIDLQYSHTFINSIRCLLLPTYRSMAAIVSEKSTVFTCSYGKAQNHYLTLPKSRSRSLQGHHLNKL